MMPFRVFKYVFSIMKSHMKKTGEMTLPVIFPAIVYTGDQAYHSSTDLLDLFHDPDGLISDILFNPIQWI